jgi:hypothetical protein
MLVAGPLSGVLKLRMGGQEEEREKREKSSATHLYEGISTCLLVRVLMS